MLVPKAGYLFNQEEDWEIWWMIHEKLPFYSETCDIG